MKCSNGLTHDMAWATCVYECGAIDTQFWQACKAMLIMAWSPCGASHGYLPWQESRPLEQVFPTMEAHFANSHERIPRVTWDECHGAMHLPKEHCPRVPLRPVGL